MHRTMALLALAFAAISAGAEPLVFNRDIRPILADACFSCHGPSKQKAGLRLDKPDSATEPNKDGRTAFAPGKPGASEAIRRIFSKGDTERMPPVDSHKKLTPVQRESLKKWVAEGAVYEPHWSFTKLAAPSVPADANPKFAVQNPVDQFLNERLAKAGLTPTAEADKPTLIRRVSFALTGLPPSLKDLDAYLTDKADGAYGRMVDRYLATPQYGEEMARHWLDLARYADTHGLHLDNERGAWLYRDLVVRSFNDNKPFDRFTVEQLAGDLLPNPTKDQLLATGFNRCNVTTGEGGSIDAEWYFRNAVDRASVAAETWLGLTAGCAQCHNHKFDPVTQKDFYSLYAFFFSAAGSPLDGNTVLHEPSVKLPTPEQEKALADLDSRLKSLAAEIAATRTKNADPPQAAALVGFGAGTRMKANVDPKLKAQAALTAERAMLDAAIPGSMIFRDAPTPRQAFVMIRGQYDKPGEKVEPATPGFLPPMKLAKPNARANRLDLANWVVSPENPLAARVYVNRLWQQFFGLGLTKNGNDLGAQGEPPTHPELLDWLAAGLRNGGWNTRATVRLLVTSAAFRRSAQLAPDVLKVDPENRLYARGPRFRLDAEQVRDNALSVGGLLNPTIGGKGVKPYQPDGIWEPVAFTGSNTQFYKRDAGAALYRRSLYTFFKRTAPPPFLSNFDAPNREQPCSRRDRSNTPLQALQLMNDVQHVEAGRAFAERLIIEGGATPADRIAFAYRVLLARAPTADELAVVKDELETHLARYAKAPDDAKKLIAVGESKPSAKVKPDELAAYTLVATMLLNLDETLTRN